jgi:hypothetical protein
MRSFQERRQHSAVGHKEKEWVGGWIFQKCSSSSRKVQRRNYEPLRIFAVQDIPQASTAHLCGWPARLVSAVAILRHLDRTNSLYGLVSRWASSVS